MFNKRILIFCIILALMAAALQAVPFVFGTVFSFAVLLNGFPVYIAARFSYTLGILVYLSAAALMALYNFCEAVFFACTNGIIGLSLGIMKGLFKSIYTVPALSALLDITILLMVNYLFGIRIFNSSVFGTPVSQTAALLIPMYFYCLVYLRLATSVDNLLHKYIDFNIHT
ncbi:MAG: hypothetical protein GX301_06640 [Gracilibacteraceae bacterium]|jgi:hypothetical protein|nr:hypothetical protein [Gracilibacteraceae bacterium]